MQHNMCSVLVVISWRQSFAQSPHAALYLSIVGQAEIDRCWWQHPRRGLHKARRKNNNGNPKSAQCAFEADTGRTRRRMIFLLQNNRPRILLSCPHVNSFFITSIAFFLHALPAIFHWRERSASFCHALGASVAFLAQPLLCFHSSSKHSSST